MIVRSFLSIVVVAGFLSVPAFAQANEKYKLVSSRYVAEATVALDADKTEQAQVLFERAIVADPANVKALIGLGHTHEKAGRIGRSLKYYRQALEIEPNALPALEAQALAFLKRDMLDRAESNLSKLGRLCPSGCKALDRVEAGIEGYKARKADEDQKEQG